MDNINCPVCNKECQEFSTETLITYECTSPVHGHVWKQLWHRQCYNAQQNAHPTLGESAPSQAVSNAETLSTSDGVPPSAPARVA